MVVVTVRRRMQRRALEGTEALSLSYEVPDDAESLEAPVDAAAILSEATGIDASEFDVAEPVTTVEIVTVSSTEDEDAEAPEIETAVFAEAIGVDPDAIEAETEVTYVGGASFLGEDEEDSRFEKAKQMAKDFIKSLPFSLEVFVAIVAGGSLLVLCILCCCLYKCCCKSKKKKKVPATATKLDAESVSV